MNLRGTVRIIALIKEIQVVRMKIYQLDGVGCATECCPFNSYVGVLMCTFHTCIYVG